MFKRHSQGPIGQGLTLACLLAFLTLGLQGCGPDTSALSYQEFKDKLSANAIDDKNATVIMKKDLIRVFGNPERIQQERSYLHLYYRIADGLLQIEGMAPYWNGEIKYTYCNVPEVPDDPEVAKILAQTGWTVRELEPAQRAAVVQSASSPEQNQRLADWYLKTHPELVLTESQAKAALEPFTAYQLVKRIGPFWITELRDRTDPIQVENSGRFQRLSVKNGKASFVQTLDEDTKELENSGYEALAEEAGLQLSERNVEYRTKWEEDYRKQNRVVVDEPCLVVLSTRVY